MRKHSQGFSIIELMIVIVIVGIIATIAIPSYESYMTKARRAEAHAALMEVAARVERATIQASSYEDLSLADLNVNEFTGNSLYQITMTTTANGYTISALPIGIQENDTECGTLTLDQTGTKGATGYTETALLTCW